MARAYCVALCLLPAAFAMHLPAATWQQRDLRLVHHHATTHRLRPARLQMIDPSLATDAAALNAAIGPPPDPHTLANIIPDMFNTAVIAAVGLAGAYVTQVRLERHDMACAQHLITPAFTHAK